MRISKRNSPCPTILVPYQKRRNRRRLRARRQQRQNRALGGKAAERPETRADLVERQQQARRRRQHHVRLREFARGRRALPDGRHHGNAVEPYRRHKQAQLHRLHAHRVAVQRLRGVCSQRQLADQNRARSGRAAQKRPAIHFARLRHHARQPQPHRRRHADENLRRQRARVKARRVQRLRRGGDGAVGQPSRFGHHRRRQCCRACASGQAACGRRVSG